MRLRGSSNKPHCATEFGTIIEMVDSICGAIKRLDWRILCARIFKEASENSKNKFGMSTMPLEDAIKVLIGKKISPTSFLGYW